MKENLREKVNVKQYNYMESDEHYFCTIVNSSNKLLLELFEILHKENVIVPIFEREDKEKPELKLKKDEKYSIIIDTEEDGFSYFWIFPSYKAENENNNYLVENKYVDLKEALKIIRKNHY